jgi:hypothetical protein
MITASTTAVARDIASAARGLPIGPGKAKLDFARLVGDGWQRLAPDIRNRFTEKPHVAQPIRYSGVMSIVTCSPAGLALAQFCRLLGTPFAPRRGSDVPTVITLRAVLGEDAVIWDREYRYPERAPILVRSTKRTADDGRLLECVGGGFGMSLDVYEEDGALHFRSRRYFWRRGKRLWWLPPSLSPGVTHVAHEDLGDGRFRFLMTVRHPLFGTLFHQDGTFYREESPL